MLWSVIQTGVALAKLDTMNQRLEKSEHNGDEVLSAEKCYLRIYPYSVNPEDPYKGIIDVAFEIICHNNVNTLSNYTTRVDSIIASLLTSLNGVNVGGVGVLFFDAGKSRGNKVQNFNQIPYKAKVLIMSVRSG
jgi:hypothetical protein